MLNDKLFLHCSSAPCIDYAYDPRIATWHKLERAFSSSDRQFHRPLVLVSSLGDVGDCRVVLTCTYRLYWWIIKIIVFAIKFLNELCKAIQPSYYNNMCTGMNVVDLGNSKVCVIIGGLAERIPSLCILF
ncbi:hypothetical protein AAHE18_05G277900 [Arachis hypogaea]